MSLYFAISALYLAFMGVICYNFHRYDTTREEKGSIE